MAAVDLVISFDTTSSMHAVLEEARVGMEPILRSLFEASPDLRVGLVLHGDYGDLYETRLAQPTNSVESLARFLSEAPSTCGQDYPECYELVLHQAATKLRWRSQSDDVTRLLVLVGDAVPHEPHSKRNKYGLDWRKEARTLADMGVSVYCVDCGGVGTGFYGFAHELSSICRGATVPYQGCRQLGGLLMHLVRTRGGHRQALADKYRSYHSDSRRAATVRTAARQALPQPQKSHASTTSATAGGPTPRGLALALARGGGIALGKTASCASRLLMYFTMLYLLYTVCLSNCI